MLKSFATYKEKERNRTRLTSKKTVGINTSKKKKVEVQRNRGQILNFHIKIKTLKYTKTCWEL